jgi:ADP-heptose:LPS heptosyltransferase
MKIFSNKLISYIKYFFVDLCIKLKFSNKFPDNPKTILIVLLGGIGDSILAIEPIIEFLRLNKRAEINVLVKKEHAALLKHYLLDIKIITYCENLIDYRIYDLIILLKSDIEAKLNIIKFSKKSTAIVLNPIFDSINPLNKLKLKLFVLHRKKFYAKSHMKDIFSQMLKVSITTKIKIKIKNHVSNSLNVGLHVAGSNPIRQLLPSILNDVIISCPDYIFHIIGGRSDYFRYKSLLNNSNVINLIGELDLIDLGQYISNLDLVICPDSMVLHYADSLGIMVISIMGNAMQETYGPYHNSKELVLTRNPNCSPCSRIICNKFNGFSCIQDIKAFEIIEMLDKFKLLMVSHEN